VTAEAELAWTMGVRTDAARAAMIAAAARWGGVFRTMMLSFESGVRVEIIGPILRFIQSFRLKKSGIAP
jgi:hypothetical protein